MTGGIMVGGVLVKGIEVASKINLSKVALSLKEVSKGSMVLGASRATWIISGLVLIA